MRLLHIVPTYWPATRYGGPIEAVHGLCRGLASRGHSVEVCTTNVDGPGVSRVPLSEPVNLDGVKVHYFQTGIGRRLYRSPGMAIWLDRNVSDFDLIHLHSVFLWPTLKGAAVARTARVPYLVAPHGMLVPELIQHKSRLLKSTWIRLFEQRNLAHAASVHLTSSTEFDSLTELRLRTRRIDKIPNGFDLPTEVQRRIEARDWRQSNRGMSPVVLNLGRISWKKGLDRLILSMHAVPSARLIIAGNDEEGLQPYLQALAAQAGLADRVSFAGPVQGAAKWALFEQADVFALASHSENFGIAVLEAMACGVPVVVTPEVGLADTVRSAGAGRVVAGEPEVFGGALAELLADASLRADMGDAGQRIAREQFSWGAVAAQTEAVYRELLANADVSHG